MNFSLIMYAWFLKKSLNFRTPEIRIEATTKFIISLAISDCLFCGINVPAYAYAVNSQEFLTPENCKFWTFMKCINSAASIYNLVLITFSHYMMICHIEKFKKVK